jgi:hypothetical protein
MMACFHGRELQELQDLTSSQRVLEKCLCWWDLHRNDKSRVAKEKATQKHNTCSSLTIRANRNASDGCDSKNFIYHDIVTAWLFVLQSETSSRLKNSSILRL